MKNDVAFLLGTAITAAAQATYAATERFVASKRRKAEELAAKREERVLRTVNEIQSMRDEMHAINEYLANRSKRS